MTFIENVEKERYEKFLKESNKSHFLQSYLWGEFAKKEKNLIPHYVGLEENNTLKATALILEKKLPFNYSYYYIPRGFILDYNNTNLIKEFTDKLKSFAKKNKAIFIKIDPDITYHEELNNGEVLIKENDKFINDMKSIGYKHLGFTKNFETMQPRYTFRINFNKDINEIVNNYSKTTKQRIKKANDLNVKVRIGNKNDIKDFYDLMILTENRKDFITHNLNYYKSLYDIWNKDNSCNIFLGSVNISYILDKLIKTKKEIQEEISNIPKDKLSKSLNVKLKELNRRLDKINDDIVKYNDYNVKYNNKDIILSAHFIIEYNDKAWVLYAGNHNILTDTYTNYKTYDEHIKYYYNKGIKTYDQFGTIGDLRKNNPLLGLHEFKKKFGGNYVEFCGEFDLVLNKFMYFVFTKLVPIYRKVIKFIAKKKRSK